MATEVRITVTQDGKLGDKPILNETEVVLNFDSEQLMELPSLRQKIQRAANAMKARFDDDEDVLD